MAMLGSTEILLIFVAIILLFGASKLPDLARSMGRSMGEFKRGQVEVEKELQAIKTEPVQPYAKEQVELTRVQRMAKNLNIEITGKSEDQLLSEIERKMAEQESKK
jgi:sec-independent protein translocase protein TatA